MIGISGQLNMAILQMSAVAIPLVIVVTLLASRYVQRVGSFKLSEIPFGADLLPLAIPCVLLFVKSHVRSLKPHRHKGSPAPTGQEWHRKQADEMRGLQAPPH